MYIDQYIDYIASVRRYSQRTCEIYRESLEMFMEFAMEGEDGTDEGLVENLMPQRIRGYEVYLFEEKKMSSRTVNLHMSVLSGFCKYLMKREIIDGNPARMVKRPKVEKRLPEFYQEDAIGEYFRATEPLVDKDLIYVSNDAGHTREMYEKRLRRAIISTLYSTGVRRSELIGLNVGSIDLGRKTAKILGKGDKMREIPLTDTLCQEISLYLQAVDTMVGGERTPQSPLFVTFGGRRLYPEYVDRAIKTEFSEAGGITGRKSPHVLRHTIATELLNNGADLNSIKELLGHSSLAATQIYTHNSIAKLKKAYESAHPRAERHDS